MASYTKVPDVSLDKLFPLPLAYRTDPATKAGPTYDSARELVRLLKVNHAKYHIFFNDNGFHNHTSHHLFALYDMGASPALLEAAYESQIAEGKVKGGFDSPGNITEHNWKEHLGDENYYRAYLAFFSHVVLTSGIPSTLEKYVFSPDANFPSSKDLKPNQPPPQMFNRFISGLIHPLIHAGHGVEFDMPGMIAEGLAMATATGVTSGALVPKEAFYPSPAKSPSSLISITVALNLYSTSPTPKPAQPTPHALSILSQVLADPHLVTKSFFDRQGDRSGQPYGVAVEARGEYIRAKYASQWDGVDGGDMKQVEDKLEELAWLVSVCYGVGGFQGEEFKPNFFLMHCVTSSHFLPSYMLHLSPPSRALLLRTFLSLVLTYYISRGRPPLDCDNFYARTSVSVVRPGSQDQDTASASAAKPNPRMVGVARAGGTANADSDSEDVKAAIANPNTWSALLSSSMLHPEEHLAKVQRTLAFYASKYGTKPPGVLAEAVQKPGAEASKVDELKGIEKLDGTIFVRAAGMTAEKLGWVREGDEVGAFDGGGWYD